MSLESPGRFRRATRRLRRSTQGRARFLNGHAENPSPRNVSCPGPPAFELKEIPANALALGLPTSGIWTWVFKVIECGLKNIALAIQGKWLEFATAVITCALK